MAIRVLLADDHTLFRAGIKALLDSLGAFDVVAEAADGRQAIELAGEHQPQIALLDVSMPVLSGLDAIPEIRRVAPATGVIVMSMHATAQHAAAALKAGALGYVVKTATAPELERSLRTVAEGSRFVCSLLAAEVEAVLRGCSPDGAGAARDRHGLTARQRQILKLIAEGQSTMTIARLLSISHKTVETHRAELMRRLDIFDVAGLTRFALRTGVISLE